MSRRGSIMPNGGRKGSHSHDTKKRVSLRDNTLSPNRGFTSHVGDIKEGEIYYKTVHIFPSLPEFEPDVTITVAKHGRDARAGSSAGHAHVDVSRRGSVLSERSASPDPSFHADRAASIATSAGGVDSKRPKLVIWPEWNDADVSAEKWDVAHKGKEKDKGKSPVVSHLFEDPEGRVDLPSTLRPTQWKRPIDYITEKTPVVVDTECLGAFDLTKANEHLHESELMRYIISQITALWEMSAVKPAPTESNDPNVSVEQLSHSWRPWEHIFTINKVVKGPHIPPYNQYGKYAVKLYWMGCWRKVIIDDQMPCDDEDRLLLPATTNQHELWPLLLSKALIKVASLDYSGGNSSCEFGDFSVIQCLTGWIPETIPLQGFLSTPSPTHPSGTKGGGRASPLVSASQVLDKYFQLSAQPKTKEENENRIKSSKSSVSHDERQDSEKE